MLDLSGNDFKILPSTFSNLSNLQELFVNDDKYFQLNKNIVILSEMNNLKSLHLENDGLKKLPTAIFQLNNLESLYLNNNKFNQVPVEIKKIKKLKFLDFHENNYKPSLNPNTDIGFGIKINF